MAGFNAAKVGSSVRAGVSAGRALLGKVKTAATGASSFKTAKAAFKKKAPTFKDSLKSLGARARSSISGTTSGAAAPYAKVRKIPGTAMSTIRSAVGRGTYQGMQKASNVANKMGMPKTGTLATANAPKVAGFASRNIGKIGAGAAAGAGLYGLSKRKKKKMSGF